jgi:MFS family permease
MRIPSFLTRNIILLSVVSLFTDIASEMLYPVMPLYLASIGYGAVAVGLIEGIVEAVAGLGKVWFGYRSDRSGKRNRFIRLGYGISAFAKPLIGLSTSAGVIFFIRFLDKVGKGIRTSPRDAIMASESTPEYRGRVFGFHRGMDTLGALIGPVIALVFISRFPSAYRNLFLLAVIPGAIAVICTLLLSAEKQGKQSHGTGHSFSGFRQFWRSSDNTYRKLIVGFALFAIVNSSNAFLLLRAKQIGFPDTAILLSYILYNFVYAALSYPLGTFADRFGFRGIWIGGLLIFALVYSALGYGFSSPMLLYALMGLYGVFGAVEDGIVKAWLSLHIDPQYRATGLGLHMTLNSFGLLCASVMTGFLWDSVGARVIFSFVSLFSLCIAGYFLYHVRRSARTYS